MHTSQVDSEGRKFGKSTGGAIWLSADKLSPYKFYQYLFQVTDADVIKFLRRLTFLPLDEIAALEAAMQQPDYVPNTAQRQLAEAVTRCGTIPFPGPCSLSNSRLHRPPLPDQTRHTGSTAGACWLFKAG